MRVRDLRKTVYDLISCKLTWRLFAIYLGLAAYTIPKTAENGIIIPTAFQT